MAEQRPVDGFVALGLLTAAVIAAVAASSPSISEPAWSLLGLSTVTTGLAWWASGVVTPAVLPIGGGVAVGSVLVLAASGASAALAFGLVGLVGVALTAVTAAPGGAVPLAGSVVAMFGSASFPGWVAGALAAGIVGLTVLAQYPSFDSLVLARTTLPPRQPTPEASVGGLQHGTQRQTLAATAGYPTLGEPSRSAGRVPHPNPARGLVPSAFASDECEIGNVSVQAASRRGVSHSFSGEPRQDDFAIAGSRDGKAVFACVADGLGSGEQSELGSHWAVRLSITWLARNFRPDEPHQIDAREFADQIARQMLTVCKRLLGPTFDQGSIATTLVAVALDTAAGSGVVIRIGDSTALVGEGLLPIGGGEADSQGPLDSSTSALPMSPESVEVFPITLPPIGPLLLATDGLAGPILTAPDAVGSVFRRELRQPMEDALEFQRLVGFDRRGALDDRTGVALWHASTLSDEGA